MPLRVLEEDNYLFLDTLILFLLVNYSPQIMLIYVGMGLLGFMAYTAARNKGIPLIPFSKSRTNHFDAILIGLVGLGIFAVVYKQINTLFVAAPTFPDFMSATFLMGSAPALGASTIAAFLVFGILIPRVETPFFFRTLMGWFAWKYNLTLSKWNTSGALISIGALSIVFMLFHLTAKGVTNLPELLATLSFGIISGIMIVVTKEVKPAAYFHMFTNIFALLGSF